MKLTSREVGSVDSETTEPRWLLFTSCKRKTSSMKRTSVTVTTDPRTMTLKALAAAGLLSAGLTLSACDVEQTEEGALPDVDVDMDVDADPGNLPEYDVDWANVDVGTTEETITVPKLRVVMEEETVSVPVIDVDMPNDEDDAGKVRRTIRVSAQVPGEGYEIDVKNIYYSGGELYVVSHLTGENQGGNKEIVSDSIVINAPESDVNHIIVGERPEGAYNEQYRYVSSMDDIDLSSANVLYERD